MTSSAVGPGFWTVVRVLLCAARKRGLGRMRRQLRQRRFRGGRAMAAWPAFGFIILVIFAAALNVMAAFDLAWATVTAERVQAEEKGRVVVEYWFAGRTEEHEADAARMPAKRAEITRAEDDDIAIEAPILARRASFNGDDLTGLKRVESRLRAAVRHNPKALISEKSLWWQPGALPDIVALSVLLLWSLMLVCQGEGPTEVLRSRHPMWEWLFSHPASPAAIFLAEMIAPIAANPVFLTAPVFPGLLFALVYGRLGGIVAAIFVGVPTTLALACVGKAIEIHLVLRMPPRLRGGLLGAMAWFGFASGVALFVIGSSVPMLVAKSGHWLAPFTDLPWPPTRTLAGFTPQGTYVFWRGIVLCWLIAAILIAGAVAFSVASLRNGLEGQSLAGAPARRVAKPVLFGREPIYRKELLWFRRDSRALVQAILVPVSLAALQAFNLRGLVSQAGAGWNIPCGIAIVFGTYFLLTVGPQSLASEGQALWIAQTWPRGLETLLKTKAKLWAAIATAIVAMVLVYAALRFPADLGRIVAVGVLWLAFARATAEKTVTLATVTSSSGEPEKLPAALRWAAMLGTLTFAVGIFTRQWSFAIAGVVYSVVTAAAMWQNFRARLPFLSDPWSEPLPTPPTLLHAMVTISAMIEAVSVLSAIALGALAAASVGREWIGPIDAALYGLCALAAALALSRFLARRGVRQRDIWLWHDGIRNPLPIRTLDTAGRCRVVLVIAVAAGLGAVLAVAAHLYLVALHAWPELARTIDAGRRRMDEVPNLHAAYLVMAVGFAPFAEEFLFRGLLYRALDREWGGWRAVLGAGAFFAVYHPALSWAPVAALGAMNAVLFKQTGRLAPAVAAHMAYNGVLLEFFG